MTVLAAGSRPWDLFGWFADHRSEVLDLLWSHTWLSVLPVVIGLLVALPIGWLAQRYRWVYPPVVSVTGLLYTIPSIALFLIMPTLLGTRILDPLNVVISLSVYTVALLVRVVADGLAAPEEIVEADPVPWEWLTAVHDADLVMRLRDGELSMRERRGLGLEWSHELVERARRSVGGTVSAARRGEGRGATFTVTLPLLAGGPDVARPSGEGYSGTTGEDVGRLKAAQN